MKRREKKKFPTLRGRWGPSSPADPRIELKAGFARIHQPHHFTTRSGLGKQSFIRVYKVRESDMMLWEESTSPTLEQAYTTVHSVLILRFCHKLTCFMGIGQSQISFHTVVCV